jgi:hypothetical protein
MSYNYYYYHHHYHCWMTFKIIVVVVANLAKEALEMRFDQKYW